MLTEIFKKAFDAYLDSGIQKLTEKHILIVRYLYIILILL